MPPRERTVHGGCGVSRDALLKALQGAPSTSAPGPLGTRFSHLQAYKGHGRALFWLGALCDRLPSLKSDGAFEEAFLRDYNDALATAFLATATKNAAAVNDLSDKFVLVNARGSKLV